MSNNATGWITKPPADAYPRDKRLQTMRDVVRLIASKAGLKLENAPAFARTYGLKSSEVEAEMMKYLSEETGK